MIKAIHFILRKFYHLFANDKKEGYRFAFLVHPRGLGDIHQKYPFARVFPDWFVKKIFWMIGPVVIGKIHGLKNKEGEKINGDIIAVPLVAKDMLVDRKRSARAVEKAICLAEKRGAKIVGLGSLTSVVVHGGIDVANRANAKITNGNALTSYMAHEGIRMICKKRGLDVAHSKVAIVGATGSIGSAVAKLLIRDDGVCNEILLGRTAEHLERLKKEMREDFPAANSHIATDIGEIKEADVVVVATSADGAIIKESDLKKNAIVYDVTQPQNVPASIIEERPDVVVVDGAISKLPEGVWYTVNMKLARGESFSCLAETMILALEKYDRDFCIGHATLSQVDIIADLALKYGFERAPLRSWGKIIQ